jgi:glycyl-tRNA synthetase beta chain
MGGYYARAEGLPDAVADAIRDHYKPVGQGDDVPTAPVTVAVALADKLDILAQFFVEGLTPTGSKDPFALRRQALAVLALLQVNGLRFGLSMVLAIEMVRGVAFRAGVDSKDREASARKALQLLGFDAEPSGLFEPYLEEHKQAAVDQSTERAIASTNDLLTFFADRLKVQQKEAGVRHDLIDAVFALGGEDDLVRLLARVHALQAFVTTEDGRNLLAGYKRAANILKKEDFTIADAAPHDGEEDPLVMIDDPAFADIADQFAANVLSYTPEPAEQALMDALDQAGPLAEAAVAAEEFTGAMAALASLRAPIDAFFENVTVNDSDPQKRDNRLALLDQFRAAVHNVADFSRIEG